MAKIIHDTSITVAAHNNDVTAIKYYLMMNFGNNDFETSLQTIIDDPTVINIVLVNF